jgi:hypothetical protein
VEITAYGSHQQHADAFHSAIPGAQERLQHGHAGFHRPRCDQYLRHVEHVVLEILADDAHAGDQALVEHFLDGTPFGKRVLRHLLDFFGLSLVEVLVHQGVVGHGGF